MKKLLILLGATFLVIIMLTVVGIGLAVVKGSTLDKQSKAYVDSTVPIIVSSWDEQELLNRASPEFIQSSRKDELDKLYVMFRKLGKLRTYGGSEGQSYVSLTSQNGKTITASYTATTTFDAGSAQIKITLIRHNDQWQILGFHVDSDVFLQQ
ncbi:MAG: hypothetical protein ABSE48_16525 [Verrucomicrobiota bacterium]|jgi:hypothetical protein